MAARFSNSSFFRCNSSSRALSFGSSDRLLLRSDDLLLLLLLSCSFLNFSRSLDLLRRFSFLSLDLLLLSLSLSLSFSLSFSRTSCLSLSTLSCVSLSVLSALSRSTRSLDLLLPVFFSFLSLSLSLSVLLPSRDLLLRLSDFCLSLSFSETRLCYEKNHKDIF